MRLNFQAVRGDVCLGPIISYFCMAITLWRLPIGYLTVVCVSVSPGTSLSPPSVAPKSVSSIGSLCGVCEYLGYVLRGVQVTRS